MATIETTCPKCGRPAAGARCTWCGVALNAKPAEASAALKETLPLEKGAGAMPANLGRFRILTRLGSGSFGVVFKAFDPVLEREVALKMPNMAALATAEVRNRFLRESKAAAQLRHPNIVPTYDAGADSEHFYIASAFVEGRTLDAAQSSGRRLDPRQAAQLVLKLAEALDYAHQQGIVHRDVKPANIMVDLRGEPHLMDFGLARWEQADEKLTHDGALLGTPAYMSPEQAGAKLGPVGPASDQYNLGVVLYELLSGQLPFTGSLMAVMQAIREQPPPRLRKLRPDLPRDMETICHKALSKQPDDRYGNCRALATDLRRWLEGEPIQARKPGVAERSWRWIKQNPVLTVLGTAAAMLAVVSSLTAAGLQVARQTAESHAATAQQALGQAQSDRTLAEEQRTKAMEATKSAEAQRAAAEQQRKAAEAARAESDELRQTAETALADANAQRLFAQQQRAKAEAALAESDAQRRLAEQRQADLLAAIKARADLVSSVPWFAYAETWLGYTAKLEQARRALAAGKGGDALAALQECNKEHRAWEWSYLRELAEGKRPKAWTYDCPQGLSVLSTQYSPLSTWLTLLVGKPGTPGDTRAVLIELETGEALDLSTMGAGRGVSYVSFHPDEECLAMATPAGITIWALPVDKKTTRLRAIGRCLIARSTSAALAPASPEMLVATQTGSGYHSFYRCHTQTGAVLDGPWHLGRLVKELGNQERVETIDLPSQLPTASFRGSLSFDARAEAVFVCAATYQGARFDCLMKLTSDPFPIPAPDGHPTLPTGFQLPTNPIVNPDWSMAIGSGGVVTDVLTGKQLTRHDDSTFTPVSLAADGSRLLARQNNEAPLSVWDARQLKYGIWWKVMDLDLATFGPGVTVSGDWKHFASVSSQRHVMGWRLP